MKNISTYRTLFKQRLAREWIKQNRPDVWEQIEEAGNKKFPPVTQIISNSKKEVAAVLANFDKKREKQNELQTGNTRKR